MVIKKKEFFKALEDDGEIAGKDNPFKPAYWSWKPKVLIIIEKLSVFEKIKEEIKDKNYDDIISIVCSQGFPADYLTTESIKRIVTPRTRIYYFGDLDPVSLCIYYALKKGNSLFKKSKDLIKLKFIGITPDDIKQYGVPSNHLIKFTTKSYKGKTVVGEEKIILDYLEQSNLLPELKEEINFLNKGWKVELESLYIALKNKGLTIIDYFKDKNIL